MADSVCHMPLGPCAACRLRFSTGQITRLTRPVQTFKLMTCPVIHFHGLVGQFCPLHFLTWVQKVTRTGQIENLSADPASKRYPWLLALWKRFPTEDDDDDEDAGLAICGAALVSSGHAITAAHCVVHGDAGNFYLRGRSTFTGWSICSDSRPYGLTLAVPSSAWFFLG